MEEWFDFPGYEDRWQITRSGTVRSKVRMVNSPVAGGQRRIGGKILKPGNTKGYPSLVATVNGRRCTAYIHRAIALLFVPNPDQETTINHIDGCKINNAPENLEWCSHLENMRHAYRTGLAKYPKTGPGEDSPSAKLDNERVRQIKRRLNAGESQRKIAEFYGVAQGTVNFIARGVTWSHVEP